MQEQLSDFVEMLTNMLNGDEEALAAFGESPVDYLEAQTSDVPVEDVDPLALLGEALAGSDLDADAQAEVLAALTGASAGYDTPAEGGGYTAEQLADVFAQSINATLEEGDHINVDNSLYADAGEADHYGNGGEIKGGIDQYNTTNITDADDGAVIADGAYESNFQTGTDNTQVDDTWAENITSGDGNTVASGASVIGDGNVNAGHIANSEFGEGNQDRSVDLDVDIKDSFTDDDYVTKDYSDDDTVTTEIDVDVNDGHGHHGYEAIEEVPYDGGVDQLQEIADELLD